MLLLDTRHLFEVCFSQKTHKVQIIQQFFWPIITLIICVKTLVKTYKKFGLVAKIGVGTFVCLIYIQNVKILAHCLYDNLTI